MKLSAELFPPLFKEVQNVQETMWQYCIANDAIPVPMDNLQYAIEQEFDVTIDVYTVPLASSLLRGMIKMYQKKSVIFIDDALNTPWTRYVFAKEASHHLLTSHHLLKGELYYTKDPVNVIESIVLDESEIDGDVALSLDVQSEDLSKFAAIELLLPFPFRGKQKSDVDAGKTSTYEISQMFEIPEHVVQFALADKYANFSASIWKQIPK